MLDWSGGKTRIYPHQTFDGVDLSLFTTSDGGKLADDADHFKQRVLSEVSEILDDMTWIQCDVRNDDFNYDNDETVVLLTQSFQPGSRSGVGEGEYDPCDEEADNQAIVFGEALRQLAPAFTFDEWVLIFANTCAHEIGHTLGFAHVERDEFLSLARPLYVELMLDGHTVSELRSLQRFIMPQNNCPRDDQIGVMGLTVHHCSCGSH